jgi:hypothetical protein
MSMPDRNDTSKAVKTSQQVHRFGRKDLKPNRSRVLPDRNAKSAIAVNRSIDRSDSKSEVDPFNPFRNISRR